MAEELLDKVRDVVEGEVVCLSMPTLCATGTNMVIIRTLMVNDIQSWSQPSCSPSPGYESHHETRRKTNANILAARSTEYRVREAGHHTGNVCGVGWDCLDISHRGTAVAYLESQSRKVAAREFGDEHGMITSSYSTQSLPFFHACASSI